MEIGNFFKKYRLEKIRLNLKIVQMELTFQEADKDAAWELYIEMLTRVVTQTLPAESGDEQVALDSIYSLFPVTREILRRRGRGTIQFTKVAVPVLNQIVRPFSTKWHSESLSGAFDDPAKRKKFRQELQVLQGDLCKYNRMLAEIASVEDLTDLEGLKEE